MKIKKFNKKAISITLDEKLLIFIMLITVRINMNKIMGQMKYKLFLTEKNIRKLGKIKTKYKSPANREKEKVPSKPLPRISILSKLRLKA